MTQFNSCIHVFHSSTSVYRGQLCGWSIGNTQISWIKATHLDLCYWNRGEQSIQLSTLLFSMCWPCYSTIPCAFLHGKTSELYDYTHSWCFVVLSLTMDDLLLFQLQVIGSTMFLLQKKTFTNIVFLWNNIHENWILSLHVYKSWSWLLQSTDSVLLKPEPTIHIHVHTYVFTCVYNIHLTLKCTKVNREATQKHAASKKPYFYYKSCEKSVFMLQVTWEVQVTLCLNTQWSLHDKKNIIATAPSYISFVICCHWLCHCWHCAHIRIVIQMAKSSGYSGIFICMHNLWSQAGLALYH